MRIRLRFVIAVIFLWWSPACFVPFWEQVYARLMFSWTEEF